MVEINEDFNMEAEEKASESSESQMKSVYPKDEEGLVEFLHCCKIKESEVMLCPRRNAVFDKKTAKEVENVGHA